MFWLVSRWIGARPVRINYENKQAGKIRDANKIADEESPLLLPFSIDPVKGLPQPVKYDDEKLGIDFHEIIAKRKVANPLASNGWTFYKIAWKVGARPERD